MVRSTKFPTTRMYDHQLTFGEKAADIFANIVGSWNFIIFQTTILIGWVILNAIAFSCHWDPYPFILLNLVLSFQAAYAGPIIMMSQNRQSYRDRDLAQDTNSTVKEEIATLRKELLRIETKLDTLLSKTI